MQVQFQDWLVDTALNRLRRGEALESLEPLTMNVLSALLENPGQVVTTEELLDRYWSGRHAEPGMVARCIAQIRQALGDDARRPRYVETIRKRGYRAIGPVIAQDATAPTADDQLRLVPPLSSIAVIPFDDLSPGGDQGWLAEGIAEELIEFLSRIPQLRVPPRTSTNILKHQQADLEAIGQRLAVDTVVNGSLRRIDERLTVVAQWIRIADHRLLWSARFERKFEDLLEIQKQIAVGIAEAIREVMGVHDTAAFLFEHRYETADLRAWELYRRGFDLAWTFDPGKMAEGRVLLQRALDHDPEYLAARVMLAWSEFDRPDHRVQVAKEVLQVDPHNVTAHRILIDHSIALWDFATAESLWNRAAAAKPRDSSLALLGYHVFASIGNRDKTLEVTRRGVSLDPMWNTQHYFLGLALLNLNQPGAAVDPLRRGIALHRKTGTKGIPLSAFHTALAMAYHLSGDEELALRAMRDGYPPYQASLDRSWSTGGWEAMNLELAKELNSRSRPEWARATLEALIGQLYARAGALHDMYCFLQRLLSATGATRFLNREAYRACGYLAQAVNAMIDYQPYWSEPDFRNLKRALDARIAAHAGSSGHAD